MFKTLKKAASFPETEDSGRYDVMKYWHPDAKKPPELHSEDHTLGEAQEMCARPESSHKEGNTSDWYFLGYVDSNSRTRHITLW